MRGRWRLVALAAAGLAALYLCGYGALRITGIFDVMWIDHDDGTTSKSILGTGWGPPTAGNRLRTGLVGGLYVAYRPLMALEERMSRRPGPLKPG